MFRLCRAASVTEQRFVASTAGRKCPLAPRYRPGTSRQVPRREQPLAGALRVDLRCPPVVGVLGLPLVRVFDLVVAPRKTSPPALTPSQLPLREKEHVACRLANGRMTHDKTRAERCHIIETLRSRANDLRVQPACQPRLIVGPRPVAVVVTSPKSARRLRGPDEPCVRRTRPARSGELSR